MGLSNTAWGEHEAGGQFDFEWSDKEERNTRNGDYFGMHSSLDPEPIPGGQSFGTALVREYILRFLCSMHFYARFEKRSGNFRTFSRYSSKFRTFSD